MPAPSYLYSLELSNPITLEYQLQESLEKAFPDNCVFLNGGESLPAGKYIIKYKTGCVGYVYNDTGWKVNNVSYNYDENNPQWDVYPIPPPPGSSSSETGYVYNGVEDEVGFVVCFNPVEVGGVGKKICSGSDTGEENEIDAVGNSLSEIDVEIDHAGGPIAIYFHAGVPQNSSSSGIPIEVATTPSIFSIPQFIIVRYEDPAEYECGPDNLSTSFVASSVLAPVYHPRTFTNHFKKPGDGSTQLSIKIENPNNTTGTLSVFYGATNITPGGSIIINSDYTFDTLDVPMFTSPLDLSDETIEIQVTSTNSTDILDWYIQVISPSCPIIDDPVIPSKASIDANIATLNWTAVSDGFQGIIYGYDVFYSVSPDTPATFAGFVSQTSDPSYLLSLSPGSYKWGVKAYSSCGESNLVVCGTEIDISEYVITNAVSRIHPTNNRLQNEVKLKWEETSDSIESFKISRGHSYYKYVGSAYVSTFDWVDCCIIPKVAGVDKYSLIIDLRKDSTLLDPSFEAFYNDPPEESVDPTIIPYTGLSQDILRKIFLKSEDEDLSSHPDTHHELWFRIEALSSVYFGYNSQFVMIVSQWNTSANDGSLVKNYDSQISPISQKTQYLFDQRITTSASQYRTSSNGDSDTQWDNGTAIPENGIVQELSPLWIRRWAGFQNASRVAVDPRPFNNRQVSAWINFRGGATARLNIQTSKMMQWWNDVNYNSKVPAPRGITIDSDTGDAYVTGGDQINNTWYLNKILYSENVTNNTPQSEIIPGAVFKLGYGATADKHGRTWVADNSSNARLAAIKQDGTGGTYVPLSNTPYGICTDFWGNVWCGVSPGCAVRVNIDPITGTINTTPEIYPIQNLFVGGMACDLPPSGSYTSNLWATHTFQKQISRLNFTVNSSNQIISYSNSYIDLSPWNGGVEGPHGIAVDSDNNMWAVQLSRYDLGGIGYSTYQKIYKIYQTSNSVEYIDSNGLFGGLFCYNQNDLETGLPRFTNPSGPFRADDPDHPMWHKCYDEFDTNTSYDLSQLRRYIAWLNLSNAATPPHTPIRKFPHYDLSGPVLIANNIWTETVNITDSSGKTFRVAILTLGPHVDYGKWQCYMYSDFIGSVSATNPGLYPLTYHNEKYKPVICKVLQ